MRRVWIAVLFCAVLGFRENRLAAARAAQGGAEPVNRRWRRADAIVCLCGDASNGTNGEAVTVALGGRW